MKLDSERIRALLPEEQKALPIRSLESAPSTNSLLKELAEAGETRDYALVSAAQTAGKGRLGRSFFSPPGTGLYISLLLHPACAPEQAQLITACAAVAAAQAIESVFPGLEIAVKWVNDLFCRKKKIAGILTEGALDPASGRLSYAVLGLGVNLCDPPGGFAAELSAAGSLLGASPCPEGGRENLAAAFISRLLPLCAALPDRGFLDEYRARCFVIGKKITVPQGAGSFETVLVRGVDDEARLIVQFDGGGEKRLQSGEIIASFTVL